MQSCDANAYGMTKVRDISKGNAKANANAKHAISTKTLRAIAVVVGINSVTRTRTHRANIITPQHGLLALDKSVILRVLEYVTPTTYSMLYNHASTICVSCDGKHVISIDYGNKRDTITIWDIDAKTCIRIIKELQMRRFVKTGV